MLVTRPTADEDALLRIVVAAVAGGVDWVQVRDRDAPVGAMRRLLPRLTEAVAGRARLLVNHPDWPDLAPLADGVHLPERGGPVAAARALLGPSAWIGRSIHLADAAVAAAEEGADYLVAGSIFPTTSHPGAEPAGLGFLAGVAAAVDLPVVAIGGITPENTGDCLRAGAIGVAVLSALMDAADPREVAAAYRRAMREDRSSATPGLPAHLRLRTRAAGTGVRMRLVVNGKPREVEGPLTLSGYLAALGLHERMIVVERNGEIVRREQYAETHLQPDDTLEIVQMMAGG
jgi:thiamine-phosphate pyrophosphorylase